MSDDDDGNMPPAKRVGRNVVINENELSAVEQQRLSERRAYNRNYASQGTLADVLFLLVLLCVLGRSNLKLKTFIAVCLAQLASVARTKLLS